MNRMRELRKGSNLTMKQLGEMVGVTESTISFYETGKHEPDIKTIETIADILGTTIDYLVGHDVNPNANVREDEKEIMQLYKKLNDEGKTIAMKTMRALSSYHETASKRSSRKKKMEA